MVLNLKKLWGIFPKKHKYSSFLIIFLVFTSSALEILGISLILPLLSVLVESNSSINFSIFSNIISPSSDLSNEFIFISGFIILSLIYLLKFLILIFTFWYQSKFIHNIKYFLSKNLFSLYLKSNYEFHIQGNSAIFVRNVSSESSNILNTILSPIIIVFSEFILVLGILIFILFKEPLGGFVLMIFFIFAIYLFQNITKNKLKKFSQIRAQNDGLRYKSILEGLNGIKDIKLLNKEDSFIESFKNYAKKSFNAEQKSFFLNQIPRIWLEFVCILGITLLITIMYLKSYSPDQIIPIIGLFAFAAFRILPSSNRILNSIQLIRYGKVSLDIYMKELELTYKKDTSQNDKKLCKFNNEIELRNISYSYPGSNIKSITNINLQIKKGEILGIIGRSGSGKTTLVDIVLGLLCPTGGSIYVDNNLIDVRSTDWKGLFGYVQQNIFLIDDSFKKNIALGVDDRNISDQDLIYAMNCAQLSSFINSLPQKEETNIGEKGVKVSGGQRQRIAIARALYKRPSILILDEATSALDPDTEKSIMESIADLKGDCTIIIITHRFSTLKICDKVLELEKSKLKIVDI